LAIGKRKRSNREIIAGHQGTSNIKSMDIDVASSSSSISSSESEAGIYTNDEGREGKITQLVKVINSHNVMSCYLIFRR